MALGKRGDFSRAEIIGLLLGAIVLLAFIIYLTGQGKPTIDLLFGRLGNMLS